MGFTTVDIYLHNPEKPTEYRQVALLADTGAMYAIVPSKLLNDLGIKSLGRRRFTLANGQRIDREIGGVLYRLGEYSGHAPVIFGEEGDLSILGVTALEALGLQVDPVTKQLKPAELLLLEMFIYQPTPFIPLPYKERGNWLCKRGFASL